MRKTCANQLLGWPALLLASLLCSPPASALNITLAWDPTPERNYNLYYGTNASRVYPNKISAGSATSFTVSNLVPVARYYFAVTAVDSTGGESGYSNEAVFTNKPPVISAIADQTINEDSSTAALAFTVSDAETPAANLTLAVASSNPTLVPQANIVLGGSGTNRTVAVTPVANRSGSATITITVSDGLTSVSEPFVVNVTGVNDPPTISAVANQTTTEDTPTAVLTFTIGDVETAATNLTVTASSSNPTLVPNAQIALGGTGASRTVQLTPAANQSGSATITLRVSDGTASNSTSFVLTVNPVNDPPQISTIANQTISEDTPLTISFTVSDAETAATSLNVTATSANQTLIPDASILLGGAGTDRTLTLLPSTNLFGSAVITLSVSDGTATATRPFTVTVNSAADGPEISPLENITLDKNTSTPPIPFTVTDIDTPLASLVISATSTNQSLVTNSAITLGGSGSNRTVTVVPTRGQTGITKIIIRASDGQVTNKQSFCISVVDSNAPPALTLPLTLTATKKTAVAIPMSVQDRDAGTAQITVTLSARYGIIKLLTGISGGLTSAQIVGNNTSNVIATASLTRISNTLAAVNGATYTGVPNFVGTDSLQVIVNDNGNTGVGGPLTDTKVASVNVNGSKFDHWRTLYFSTDTLLNAALETNQWGSAADPDGDSCNNVLEYALGLDPVTRDGSDGVLVPGVTASGANQYLTITFNRRLGDPQLQYFPEVSPDQVTWTGGAGVVVQTSQTTLNTDFERVTFQDFTPITPETPRFIRLRVVLTEP